MLNLREFTERVDKFGELITKEELQTVFHSIARKIPEKKRESFLEILNHVRKKKDPKSENRDAVFMAKAQDREEMFPRHTSFHEELRRYGMPDNKKKAGRR